MRSIYYPGVCTKIKMYLVSKFNCTCVLVCRFEHNTNHLCTYVGMYVRTYFMKGVPLRFLVSVQMSDWSSQSTHEECGSS